MSYKDLSHVSYEQLAVYYNGAPRLFLNKRLLDQQNAWANLEDIKEVHELKLVVYDLIEETDDIGMLKSLAKDLTEIEFKLQELWGFTLNASFHRFWTYPKCQCPRMDNEDSYPHRHVSNLSCPLHGD